MTSTPSVDLRERVAVAVAAGASQHKAAERSGVRVASACRWCEQMRDSRCARPGTSRPSRAVAISAHTGSSRTPT